MRIGIFDSSAGTGGTIDQMVRTATTAQSHGFDSYWAPQIFGFETLAAMCVVAGAADTIELGTAVVPTYPRHPVTMAQLALTTQAVSNNRLTLGIGLSHEMVIENMFGMSYEKPARHMREYLNVLMPLLAERGVSVEGDTISASAGLMLPDGIDAPDVVVAALGPLMLQHAGSLTAGTVTWMTGPKTLADHIVPSITAAATEAGRPTPRVICALPVCVTDDEAAGRAQAAKDFEMYGVLPAYRAMLDREGAEGPADVALVGSADSIRATIESMFDSGVTEFVASEYSRDPKEQEQTRELLISLLG